MLNRLGLVIHWGGFIGSVAFAGFAFWVSTQQDMTIEALPIIAAGLTGPLGGAWVIRFILTGHKGLMPWSKAKQP
jgi:hypothetical protein